jgi:hypothetical protein
MACAVTAGYTLDCKDAVGGLKNIYFANGLPSAATITSTTASGISSVSGVSFYKYELMPQAADSFTEEITATPANGTVFYTQTVVTNFAKMSQTSRNKWYTLAQARLLTIIEKKDGTFWLLGQVNGLEVSAGSHTSGAAMGDFNGVQLTLTGMESVPAQALTSSTAFTVAS